MPQAASPILVVECRVTGFQAVNGAGRPTARMSVETADAGPEEFAELPKARQPAARTEV